MLPTPFNLKSKLTVCQKCDQIVAKYYCFDSDCPQHSTSFRYCKNCANSTTHNHLMKKITDRCDDELREWIKF